MCESLLELLASVQLPIFIKVEAEYLQDHLSDLVEADWDARSCYGKGLSGRDVVPSHGAQWHSPWVGKWARAGETGSATSPCFRGHNIKRRALFPKEKSPLCRGLLSPFLGYLLELVLESLGSEHTAWDNVWAHPKLATHRGFSVSILRWKAVFRKKMKWVASKPETCWCYVGTTKKYKRRMGTRMCPQMLKIFATYCCFLKKLQLCLKEMKDLFFSGTLKFIFI